MREDALVRRLECAFDLSDHGCDGSQRHERHPRTSDADRIGHASGLANEGVEIEHQAACPWSRSSVPTEASSTRSPTYTRSTSATASVMSPETTTPLLSTRSTSSIKVICCSSGRSRLIPL